MPSNPMLERAREWMRHFGASKLGCCPDDTDPVWEIFDSDDAEKSGQLLCGHDLAAFAREEVTRKLEERANIAHEVMTDHIAVSIWLRAEAQRVREGEDDA